MSATHTDTEQQTLPADTRLGTAELTVTDLDRSIAFYAGVLGLQLHGRDRTVARLGDGADDALVLVAAPEARRAGRHAGLYHVALLYPSRLELARVALRLSTTNTAIDGASDHGTHEAIYLPDPDGNGLELAADRPREAWPRLDQLMHSGGPDPLDLAALFALVAHEQPTPLAAEGLRVGHVHLHVNDLAAATRFYRDVLGFEVTMALPHAVFVAFGGYHHHVGFNVWRGEGIPSVPDDAVGLRHLELVLPAAALDALRGRLEAAGIAGSPTDEGLLVHDPAGNGLLLVPARVA